MSLFNVRFLKNDPKARYQGYSFFFKEGFCWTDVNSTFLKSRLKQKGIFDVISMSLFTKTWLPDWFFVSLINSTFISLYVDNFINNTSHFQINDARQTPIIIPSEIQLNNFESIYKKAVYAKKINQDLMNKNTNYDLQEIQNKLDKIVLDLYSI